MMKSNSPASLPRAVGIAAAVTLAVTLVRLLGEMQQWAPRVFDVRPGGGLSPFGITWLVLPFGFWFGRRLALVGQRPRSTAAACVWLLLGIALGVAGFVGAFVVTLDWRMRSLLANTAAVLAGLLAFRAWPRAYVVLAAYGALARLPVIVVQYVSIECGWLNHFAKGPPGSDPQHALLLLLTAAQCLLWPLGWTTLVGGLAAVLGAATCRSRSEHAPHSTIHAGL
jgi:hypothetical protein